MECRPVVTALSIIRCHYIIRHNVSFMVENTENVSSKFFKYLLPNENIYIELLGTIFLLI